MMKLKPCPFCGSEAKMTTVIDVARAELCYKVRCLNLDCLMSEGGTVCCTKELAEMEWNRRAGGEE